jgi:N-acetylneuraminic acid mutarotase
MIRARLERTILLFGVGLLFTGVAWGARDIGIRERVAAERAIAKVYYDHQIDATRPFDDAVRPETLEKAVRRSLGQSAALASYWGVPIGDDALRTEMRRIARDTRFPERLREIYAALGNDAVLVEECLARRTLADRWARAFFARDPGIHRAARHEAETLRRRLVDGSLPLVADDPRRHATELICRRPESAAGSTPDDGIGLLDEHRLRLTVSEEEFVRLRAGAPQRVGEVGPIVEEDDAFVLRVVMAEGEGRATLASYVVPKTTWDTWWSETGASFESHAVPTVASASDTLPEPRGIGGPPTCAPGNTWDNGALGAVPDGRSSARAVWTGSAMVVWGGYRDGVYPVVGAIYDPVTDTWSRTTRVSAPVGRTDHTAVWTGSRVAIWGGFGLGVYFDSGSLYDPIADAWTPIATAGAPGKRQDHTAIWTGTTMVVWGGNFSDISGSQWLQTGGRYDPASNSWQPTSTVNAPEGRQYHTAVWTGSTMIVWGGRISGLGEVIQTGGRYDPVADAWSPTTVVGAPLARELHTAVWDGDAMLVWGGQDYVQGSPHSFNSGARYDPGADAWTSISSAGAPAARRNHTAVWTGNEMIVWGGDAGGTYFGGGGRYAPASDSWAPVAASGAPSARTNHVAVWTGSEMVVWTGYAVGGNYYESGGRYDPARDRWTPTFWSNAPSPRHGATVVWTGNLLIVWGGISGEEPFGTGGRYDPLTDAWTPTTTAGVGRIRVFHTAVWSGSEMLVWGGEPCPFPHDFGGRYDPVADSWQPIDYLTEPLFRRHHTAIWTGSRMLVWGGLTCESATSVTDSGALYDPVANTWTPLSTTGAPSARQQHTATWTGSTMLVWGGSDGDTPPKYFDTGGRYDPAAGSWTGIAKGGSPTPRAGHTAVWTGGTMIVWGGTGSSDFNTGAIYDPAANHWSATATIGAPSARIGHSAVWTGSTMIVWGGETSASGFDAVATGGRYTPATNSWAPTPFLGVPAARHDHIAAWLGSFMVVWGGRGDYELDSGGRYVLDNPDADADGVADVCDCAPSNPTAFSVPADVAGLTVASDKVTVQWSSAVPGSGSGTVHDLVRGRLGELPVGAGGSESCVAVGIAGASAQDLSTPPIGDGYWYLVRGKNVCGIGPYGHASGGSEEVSNACP